MTKRKPKKESDIWTSIYPLIFYLAFCILLILKVTGTSVSWFVVFLPLIVMIAFVFVGIMCMLLSKWVFKI